MTGLKLTKYSLFPHARAEHLKLPDAELAVHVFVKGFEHDLRLGVIESKLCLKATDITEPLNRRPEWETMQRLIEREILKQPMRLGRLNN